MSLESLGLPLEGCLRDDSWVSSISIPVYQSSSNKHIYIELPSKQLVCVNTVSSGTFGHIDVGLYGNQNVFIKRPILAGKSLFYEACIQKLVSDNLRNIGFDSGTPQPLCVFKLHDQSVGFAMEQIPDSITLDRYLHTVSNVNLPNVIIDCLLQLCAMIWHLNNVVGMNHRDLKPSNFLIVEHSEAKRRILTIDKERLEIDSRHTITLIDFGFSCLGSTETHESDVSLSTVYSSSDPCPKEGRDMYLFLAFLYIDYHSKLPEQLLHLFEQWLHIPTSDFCRFMRSDKESSKRWIYYMTGNENVTSFRSCPYRIIKDLQHFMNTV